MLPVAVRCVDPITRFCALAAFPGPNHNSLWRLPGNVPAKCQQVTMKDQNCTQVDCAYACRLSWEVSVKWWAPKQQHFTSQTDIRRLHMDSRSSYSAAIDRRCILQQTTWCTVSFYFIHTPWSMFCIFSVWLFQLLVVETVYLNKRTGLIIVEDPRGSLLFFPDISTNIPQTATNQIGFGKTVHNMFKGTGNPQWPLIRNKPRFAARCFNLLYRRALTPSESFRNVYGQIAISNQQRKPRRPIWPATFFGNKRIIRSQTKTVIRRDEERIFWILHQN